VKYLKVNERVVWSLIYIYVFNNKMKIYYSSMLLIRLLISFIGNSYQEKNIIPLFNLSNITVSVGTGECTMWDTRDSFGYS